MSTYVFVPLSDDLIFDFPEKIKGPLIPFNPHSMIEESCPVIGTVESKPARAPQFKQPGREPGGSDETTD